MRKNTQKSNHYRILFIVQFGILVALEALFCFVPFLGSIPLPTIFGITGMVATLMMIPVMVTSITLGRRAGALMGFIAGFFSFVVWTFFPPFAPLAFVFTPFFPLGNIGSLIICFLPRTLAGYFAGLVFESCQKKKKLGYGLAALVCSVTNTLLVSSFALFFFSQPLAEALGKSSEQIFGFIFMTWILQNGVCEAVVGILIIVPVCSALEVLFKQLDSSKRLG